MNKMRKASRILSTALWDLTTTREQTLHTFCSVATFPSSAPRSSPFNGTITSTPARAFSTSAFPRNLSSPNQLSIGIVGAGGVGAACASSLIHTDLVSRIQLYDVSKELCEGVVWDLEDEGHLTGTVVEYRPLEELKENDIIIITAGAKQQPGEPRTALVERNAKILRSIIDKLLPLNSSSILLLVSNPVDVLTSLAQHWTRDFLPPAHVIGSGTYLDSQRLRVEISKRIGVSGRSIHAYIIGEHGDSSVFASSSAFAGGAPVSSFRYMDPETMLGIEEKVRRKAYEIIKRKGSTAHGIGSCVSAICESILLDKKIVMPISSYVGKYQTVLGWPAVVGRSGAEYIVDLPLSPEETERVALSARGIKEMVDRILGT